MHHDIFANPVIGWIWVISNLVIGVSYFLIGFRHFRAAALDVLSLFYGAFIFSCGAGHFAMVYFMGFDPSAFAFAIVFIADTVTAGVSIWTAHLLELKRNARSAARG